MARKSFSAKHEDILIFLEENISKLVKLKVASRAKYKEYDEQFMNYLTADSIDDKDRTDMYREMVEMYYVAMRTKLQTAINDNPELIMNKLVAAYIKLMK